MACMRQMILPVPLSQAFVYEGILGAIIGTVLLSNLYTISFYSSLNNVCLAGNGWLGSLRGFARVAQANLFIY